MHMLKQWAAAAVAAIALGGLASPAAADAPGPGYQATPQYHPAPVRPIHPPARRPVVYGYPAPPPAVVYYNPPPPVVVYPRPRRYVYGGYRYVHGGYPYWRHYGARHLGHRFVGHRFVGPRHFGHARGYAFHGRQVHGRHWHR
jgi:hypothetical protein